ncbi:MAG: SulP family inorganic anion transporter [Phycisphaerae bacterium]|nr:SulP family inorganic anion transporter [Gemmatimonadaceae bacterium]
MEALEPAHTPGPTPANWRTDITAGVSLAIIAGPLCVGIALASGAPLWSGIISGVVGAIIVGRLSSSQLLVSGPAAGLAAIVVTATAQLGSFQALLVAVVLAGVMQIVMGIARAGIVGYYFPSSVVKGMIAAIGVILILKQLPHALGWNSDYMGSESFAQGAGANTFTSILEALTNPQPGAVFICAISLAVLALWSAPALKRLRVVPAPLVVVVTGILLNELFKSAMPEFALTDGNLVSLPVITSLSELSASLIFPDWSVLARGEVYVVALTIAMVASLETLLSLDATDRIDPHKRESPPNPELIAQGVGNIVSGLIGGLPLSGVIVRSAANIEAGALSRRSNLTHGLTVLGSVITVPFLLNLIPLAAIAAILLHLGYRLAQPALWMSAWRVGRPHFFTFAVTVVTTVFTDLLIGIMVGFGVGAFFILFGQLRTPTMIDRNPPGSVLRRFVLPELVTFLSKAEVAQALAALPEGSRVEIDGRSARHIDHDVLELITNFRATAQRRNIDFRLVGMPATPALPLPGR